MAVEHCFRFEAGSRATSFSGRKSISGVVFVQLILYRLEPYQSLEALEKENWEAIRSISGNCYYRAVGMVLGLSLDDFLTTSIGRG